MTRFAKNWLVLFKFNFSTGSLNNHRKEQNGRQIGICASRRNRKSQKYGSRSKSASASAPPPPPPAPKAAPAPPPPAAAAPQKFQYKKSTTYSKSYAKIPNTLIIFVNYFSNSTDSANNAKIRYVLKQVACSIPKNFMIEYGTIAKNVFSKHSDISEVVEWLEKPVEVQTCQTIFSSLLDALNSYQTRYERVEIIFHVPSILPPTEKCDYIEEFQKLPILIHFNMIRFDNIQRFGTKIMNFPGVNSIDTKNPEASLELREKSMNFVNEILEIPPEIMEEQCASPDFLLYSIISAIIAMVLTFLVTFSYHAVLKLGYLKKNKKNLMKIEKTIVIPDKTIISTDTKDQKFHDDDLGEISAASRKTVGKKEPKDFDESYKH
ncbi:unnamed protein product [Caenorhabditis angaria]|uniref:Uncharacterized protein n=1 Tax=Caenorhabditis angaria TaxID=860376 RepID=A0A9P1IJG7_9PELO|nr:unnamed protein product [Caenorhabditis angaria]